MLRAPHDAAGALGDCPHCEKEARIPGGAPPAAADPLAFIPVGEALDPEEVEAAVETGSRPPARRIDVPAPAAEASPKSVPPPTAPPPAAPPEGGVVFESADEADEPAAAGPVTFETVVELPEERAEPTGEYDPAASSRTAAPRRSRRRRRSKGGSPWLAGGLLLLFVVGIGAAGWVMYDRLSGSPLEQIAAATPGDAAVPSSYFLPPPGASDDATATIGAGVPFETPLLVVQLSSSGRGGGPAGRRAPEPDAGGMVDRAGGGMTDADDSTADDPDNDAGDDAEPPPAPRGPKAPEGAIVIAIRPGDAGRVIRVSLGDREEVRAWRDERTDLVGAKRLAFDAARREFFADAVAGDAETIAQYRDSVALNAATDLLGWSVEAVADGRLVPCCRETGSGDLWFCVPRSATVVTLRGRDLPGAGRAFPFQFVATVNPPTGDGPR